jgi:hypothetical protein
MLTTPVDSLHLKAGTTWRSFEKFRVEGARGLEAIDNGTVASLQTKTNQYRILTESDFQKLYGLAKDVDRLRLGFRVVVSAVRAVQKHPDEQTIEVLIDAVQMLGSLPELPIRDRFGAEQLENFPLDLDDEAILDPTQIDRPLSI